VVVFSNVRFKFCSMRGRPHHRPGMVDESRNEAHRSIDWWLLLMCRWFSRENGWIFLGERKGEKMGVHGVVRVWFIQLEETNRMILLDTLLLYARIIFLYFHVLPNCNSCEWDLHYAFHFKLRKHE
jgi:hypothetical protein